MKAILIGFATIFLPSFTAFADSSNCKLTQHWRSYYVCCGHPSKVTGLVVRDVGECVNKALELNLFYELKDIRHPSGRYFKKLPTKISFEYSNSASTVRGELERPRKADGRAGH